MSTANMAIDPAKARAITDYVAANPDESNRDVAAKLGVNESAVRRAKAARGVMHGCLIESIRLDGGTQFRESINDGVASEYAEAYKAGEKLPAPIVFADDDGNRWLGDGFTRVRAARLAGMDCIECELRKGTLEDAILYAAGANERHGQRRTSADRHRAIEAALKLRPESTLREIAEICRVSHELVRQVKNRIDPKFELKPDPLPADLSILDEPKPHKPAKNQPELPISDDDINRLADDRFFELDKEEDYPIEIMGEIVDTHVASYPVTLVVSPSDEIEVEETTPDGGPIDEFASWLASLPLNGKLHGSSLTKFNADAQFYWSFTKSPEFKAFEQHIAKFTKSRAAGVTYFALDRFRKSLVHPRDWKLCPSCSGTGTAAITDHRVSCQSCHGRGYHA